MSEATAARKLAALTDLASALGQAGQPQSFFEALARALQDIVGYRLFTLMVFDEATSQSARVFSTDPAAYPVGGRKSMSRTPWGDVVIAGRRSWLGRTADDIRWAFPDHEKIIAMGLGAVINMAVVYDGRFLGGANLLHAEGTYDDTHLAAGQPFASLLIPAYLGLADTLPPTV